MENIKNSASEESKSVRQSLSVNDFEFSGSIPFSPPPFSSSSEHRASIIALEGKVHAMNVFKRLTLHPGSNEAKEIRLNNQIDEMRRELDAIRCSKEEEIHRMRVQFQKLTERYKTDLYEKDQELRVMHNELVNLRGQIRVAVRLREMAEDSIAETLCIDEKNSTISAGRAEYKFEHVFNATKKQQAVFDEVKELILSVLHGYNVCLIAYGPTGSGKTFTMRGPSSNGDDDGTTEGVIPRAIRFLLEHSSQHLASIGWQFRFAASYLEVYNEEVFDLLDQRKKCDVKQNNVVGLKKLPVNRVDDTRLIMELADSFRSTASTNCNAQSSRSHAVFQIHVDGIHTKTGSIVKCCLNLVDLAGSERAKESGAQGARFTELTNINQSLTTLKKCIRAQMTRAAHVPFRESKLTWLLRAFLGGGSSKTMFIAHLNPNDEAETRRTLEFTKDLRSTNLGQAQAQIQK